MDGDGAGRIRVYRHDDQLGSWSVSMCVPHPALADIVESIWLGEGRVSYQRDRILPAAASHLLINLGPTQYRVEDGPPERRVPFRDIWYSGLQQGPIDTEAPHGSVLLGVAFRADGGLPWLGGDQQQFSERAGPLADALGDGVLALRERLLACGSTAERFDQVEGWLLRRRAQGREPHPAVRWSLRRLHESAGAVRVEALARETGYTRKHLNDLFQREVGLSAKSLARVLRFRASLALLARAERVPWAELAHVCGYFDQSHLVRDFKRYSGLSPREFTRHARPDANSIVLR